MPATAGSDHGLLEKRGACRRPGYTGRSVDWGCEGRHKACPYRTVWADGEGVGGGRGGQAQGLPLQDSGGKSVG